MQYRGVWEDLTMKRSASVLAVLMFSLVVTFLLANLSSAMAGGGNCQAKLVGKSYNCSSKQEGEPESTFCAEFVTGGKSVDFDILLLFNDGSEDLGCTCDTTGSFSSPSFDNSS